MANKNIDLAWNPTTLPVNNSVYPNTFERQGAFPLDRFSLFPTVQAAQSYASSNALAFAGQIISVSTAPVGCDAGNVTAYLIKSDGTLQELGSAGSVDQLYSYIKTLVSDAGITCDAGEVITGVTQNTSDGSITITKKSLEKTDIPTIDAAQVNSVLLSVDGCGPSNLAGDIEYLNDNKQDNLTFTTEGGNYSASNPVATQGYVDQAVSGLVGAMHFIGTSTTDPTQPAGATVAGYGGCGNSFESGDVITFGQKEYVLDNGAWRLLGDEGSYAVKGSIKNADISDDAAIAQSKIAGQLIGSADLAGDISNLSTNKVDKINRTAASSGFYKVTINAQGQVTANEAVTASDIPVGAYQFADGGAQKPYKFTVTKPDSTTQEVTVTVPVVNTTTDGLMSSTDKVKLDGITAGANKVEESTTNGNIKIDGVDVNVYSHPTYTAVDAGAKKVGLDSQGHVVLGTELTKADVGLSNVNNTSITVSATDGVTDNTNNVTYKYNHPTFEAQAASALQIGRDAEGHVVIGSAITPSTLGISINTEETSVTVGDKTLTKYVHPNGAQAAQSTPQAVKVGVDSTGHVIIGDGLTKADVGLDNVKNQAITVTNTSVSDGTNTFEKYVHPTTTAVAASAKKVGYDSTGHVVLGSALTGMDVGVPDGATKVSAGTNNGDITVTSVVNGVEQSQQVTVYTHPTTTDVTAAAVKVGKDSSGHVVLGAALTGADVGVTATTTSVTVDGTTFNQYVHPTTTAVVAAAVKVGKDSSGHVELGDALKSSDIAYDSNASVTVKTKIDALETFADVQNSGTGVVKTVTKETNGKLTVTKGTVSESELDQALQTKINLVNSTLHFKGVVSTLPDTDAEGYSHADVVILGTQEYVLVTPQTGNGVSAATWVELGDESEHLTKTEASTTYETIANCDTIRGRLDDLEDDTHTHDNKTTLDSITAQNKSDYDAAVTKLAGIAANANKVEDGDNNGEIKVTNAAGTTSTITVYDDAGVKADIAAANASIAALATSDSLKVAKTTTIAGVDLQDNITKAEMQAALDVVTGAQDANDCDFTITNKKIMITDLILDGGSSTQTIA